MKREKNRKIVIFGGTAEGRMLSETLAGEGAEVVVCVATDYGARMQGGGPHLEVRTGPLDEDEKAVLLRDAILCVDATHPYALHVTASVREACHRAGVPHLRLLREESPAEGAVECADATEAAAWLAAQKGNVLLTTGAKELSAFSSLERERLFVRVLPVPDSLALCASQGIPARNIVAMQGPFSKDLNIALIRQLAIRHLVTKVGGAPGGFPEKAAAAKETGIQLVVIRRPEERGLPFEEVLRRCRESMR